jgi:hypothetical protein
MNRSTRDRRDREVVIATALGRAWQEYGASCSLLQRRDLPQPE